MGYTPRLRVIGDWFSLFRSSENRGGRKKPAAQARTGAIRSRRLRHEPLEDRCLLAATIMVNSPADTDVRDMVLTLREAILVSNRTLSVASLSAQEQAQVSGTPTANDADTIEFTSALQGNPIDLTVARGHLEITESLVIDGSMVTGGVTISGNDPDEEQLGDGIRIFNINDLSGGTDLPVVELRSLTLINGDPEFSSELANGGAIRSEGVLNIYDSMISDNFGENGGGIYSLGPQTIENSLISGNRGSTRGGGIWASETVLITDSTITENVAFAGGGIVVDTEEGFSGELLTLINTDVTYNKAQVPLPGTGSNGGGGIIVDSSEPNVEVSILAGSSISHNIAGANPPPSEELEAGSGGGIIWDAMGDGGIFRVLDSFIENNTAGLTGGGIHLGSLGAPEEPTHVSLIFERSTLSFNKAINGGGARFAFENSIATVTVIDTMIEGNQAGKFSEEIETVYGKGGGIYLGAGEDSNTSLEFANSLITGNAAIKAEGYSPETIDFDSRGGGIYIGLPFQGYFQPAIPTGTTVTISGAVIHNNSANTGAGIAVGASTSTEGFRTNSAYGSSFTIKDSIIDSNHATNSGGGMFVATGRQGEFNIQNSRITGNTAGIGLDEEAEIGMYPHSGGGIYAYLFNDDVVNTRMTISGTTIDTNQAGSRGGGIEIFSGRLLTGPPDPGDGVEVGIFNSTISGNQAGNADPEGDGGTGGGIDVALFPGIQEAINTRIHNTTIYDNAAQTGGGINSTAAFSDMNGSSISDTWLNNTIISGNTNHFDAANNLSAMLNIANTEFNLVGPGNSIVDLSGSSATLDAGNDNIPDTDNDPDLLPLSDENGGPTPTHLPMVESEVIDSGSNSLAIVPFSITELEFDQRGMGYLRKHGFYDPEVIIVDIGAVEMQPDPAEKTCPGDFNRDGSVNTADFVVWRNMDGRSVANGTLSKVGIGADGNCDGVVDDADLALWFANFGSTCETPMTEQLPILPGDYNEDGTVDDDDFNVWETNFGSTTNLDADGNENGIVDLEDLKIWQEYRGTTVMEEILGDFDENGVVDMNDLALWEAQDPAADADGDMDVDQDDYDIWEENFGMMAAWIMPKLTGSTNGLPLDKPMQAPFVTEVTISGSNSTHDPYNFSGVTGSGAQLMTVPVAKADTLQVTFSEEVLVTSTAFTLTNVQGYTMPSVDQFTYDLDTQTASWVFDGVLPSGQYLLQLSDSIFDLDRDALDGEFTNPWSINDAAGTTSELPSGDGEAGGEFRFRYSLLAADYSHNNVVNSGDFTIWSGNNGMMSGATHGDGDGDGDGDVDQDDYDVWFGGFGGNFVNWQSSEPGMILVSTATDEDDADYSYGDVSLREALDLAAANAGHDTIVFRQDLWDSTLTLTMGQLVVDSDVTILGPGADRLAISGDDASRVFYVNSAVEATIQGLTITEGLAAESHGGGIFSEGDLTLERVVVSYNAATPNSGGQVGWGGGVFSDQGDLTIIDSAIEYNEANKGSGIAKKRGGAGESLEIVGSTIAYNESILDANNVHAVAGLVIYSFGDMEASIVNTTISNNTATYAAGVHVNGNGSLNVEFVNATIAENVGLGTGPLAAEGGIRVQGGVVTLHNSIVAKNVSNSTFRTNIGPGLSSSSTHNIIGTQSSHHGFPTGNGNQVGVSDANVGLDDLDYYGGRIKTHALLTTSYAIDEGNTELARGGSGAPLGTDGRGKAFARLAGESVDVGAFESGSAITVSTLADEDDGLHGFGDLSIREALTLAAMIPGADTIAFDAKLVADPGLIVLGEELVVDSDLMIDGPGSDLLTIDGDGNGRVFNVESGVEATISGATITGGYEYQGAGVYSEGDLVLDSVTITENEGNGYSGNGIGVYSTIGSLELRNSLVFDNNLSGPVAGNGVGGVYSYSAASLLVDGTEISGHENLYTGDEGLVADGTATVVVINSTIAGNTTAQANSTSGISIIDALNVEIINTTVSGNEANEYGTLAGIRITGASTEAELVHVTVAYNDSNYAGGVQASGGADVTLHNSIVAGNAAYNQLWGSFSSSSSYNLIGRDSVLSNGIDDGANGNQVGGESAGPIIDPRLAPLDDYGGPTKTHALYYDSPAIDAGDDAIATAFGLLYDQRGEDRFGDGDNDYDSVVDIGAFELVFGKFYGSL